MPPDTSHFQVTECLEGSGSYKPARYSAELLGGDIHHCFWAHRRESVFVDFLAPTSHVCINVASLIRHNMLSKVFD